MNVAVAYAARTMIVHLNGFCPNKTIGNCYAMGLQRSCDFGTSISASANFTFQSVNSCKYMVSPLFSDLKLYKYDSYCYDS